MPKYVDNDYMVNSNAPKLEPVYSAGQTVFAETAHNAEGTIKAGSPLVLSSTSQSDILDVQYPTDGEFPTHLAAEDNVDTSISGEDQQYRAFKVFVVKTGDVYRLPIHRLDEDVSPGDVLEATATGTYQILTSGIAVFNVREAASADEDSVEHVEVMVA